MRIGSNTLIIIISAIVALLVLNLPFKAKMYGDMTFHEEARAMVDYLYGAQPKEAVRITKAPGPVLFYAVPYLLGGKQADDGVLWKLAVGWNMLWLTLGLVFLKNAVQRLFGPSAGLVSFITVMVIPLHLYYGMGVLAESLGFVGLCFYVFGVVAIAESKGQGGPGILALAAGLLALITARPNVLIVAALFPLCLLFLKWQGATSGTIIKKFAIAYAFCLAGLLAVFAFIRVLPGYSASNNQEGLFVYVAHHGRFQFRAETWDWRFWDNDIRGDSKDYQDWQKSVAELDSVIENSGQSMQQVYSEWLLRDALENPATIVKQFFTRMLFGNYLQVSSVEPAKFKAGPLSGKFWFYLIIGGINVVNGLILLAALVGFVRFFKEKKYLLLVAIPWVSLMVFHGFIYMEQRYLFPARVCLIVFASPMISTAGQAVFNAVRQRLRGQKAS